MTYSGIEKPLSAIDVIEFTIAHFEHLNNLFLREIMSFLFFVFV